MAFTENAKKKTKAEAELLVELIRDEVLTRLPIKSVVRFQSVCKPWLYLFSDPKFVKDHLSRNSTQNPNDYDCLVASKKSKIVMLSRYKETFVLPSDHYHCQLVGSVQGLLCLRRGNKFSLWNPAIHQSREFTLSTETFPPQRSGDPIRIGLGFHHASKDYKVIVCCLSGDLWYASVYSADSDSWTDVFVPDYVFPKTKRGRWHVPNSIVKDCPYWMFPRTSAVNVFMVSLAIVKFYVESNEFKLLPEFNFDKRGQPCGNHHYELVTMQDCLTLMVCRRSTISIVDVYFLDEEGSCVWSKMHSVGPLDLYTHYLHLSQGFRYGGEIVYHTYGNFFCYDHKSGIVKRLFVQLI